MSDREQGSLFGGEEFLSWAREKRELRDAGYQARLLGKDVDACPHSDGPRRAAWLQGWHEAGRKEFGEEGGLTTENTEGTE